MLQGQPKLEGQPVPCMHMHDYPAVFGIFSLDELTYADTHEEVPFEIREEIREDYAPTAYGNRSAQEASPGRRCNCLYRYDQTINQGTIYFYIYIISTYYEPLPLNLYP